MKNYLKYHKTLALLLTAIFLLLFPIIFNNQYILHLVIIAFIWASVVSCWNLLAGYAGIFNLGQIGFFGVGAYSSALISMRLGISPWLSMVLGGLIAGFFSLLVGLPTLRLKGVYVALVTLAFSEVLRFLDSNLEWLTGGEMSLWGIIPLFEGASKEYYYYAVLLIFAVTVSTIYFIVKSIYGSAIIAIKESELSSESLGINIKIVKLNLFFVSAFFTGIMGGFYAHYILLLSPTLFRLSYMMDLFAMGIIGGTGTILGPIIGAFFVTFFLDLFRFIEGYRFMIYGSVLILIMIYRPKGIYSAILDLKNYLVTLKK